VLLFGWNEILWMTATAIVIDMLIGDPRWPTHPVIWIGRLIKRLERLLRRGQETTGGEEPAALRRKGMILAAVTVGCSGAAMWLLVWVCSLLHPWLGYAVNTWFISTTIAIKGLKDAAYLVYRPLTDNRLEEARKYVGYIVGRDTERMDEPEITRAAVETVAENIVDAVVSPLFFALLGGAPLAMAYRATNTLDSMVGYKNDKYLYFGWCSARLDDVLNWLPARLTGVLLTLLAFADPRLSGARAWRAIRTFAHLHPSPNSGIPESAVAGALGVELGGLNYYGGVASDRARMGWPLMELNREHIVMTVRQLYGVGLLLFMGGLLWAQLLG
jgi:adenosylcobinamide-phosphate synthase